MITVMTRKLGALTLLMSMWLICGPTNAQEQPVSPKVAISAAYMDEVLDEVTFIGEGQAIDQIDIVARVSGFVEEIPVRNGAIVKQGDVLFRIEDDAYAATLSARQADLGKAQANFDLASIELARKAELFSRGASPESERDIAQANELGAEAAVQSTNAAVQLAKLELSYTEIRAPFDGRIGQITVSVGELVGPGTQPLVNLVRETPINVSFSLSERQLGNLLEAMELNSGGFADPEKTPDVFVTLPNGTELEEPGKIAFMDNRISPTTGTIALLAEFANDRQLILDGAFLRVRVAAQEPKQSLLVHQAAVQRDQRGDFVLVVNAQQMVEQRYLVLGKQVGTAVVVIEGLQAGESVIVEGLQRVRPGVQVDAILAGEQGKG